MRRREKEREVTMRSSRLLALALLGADWALWFLLRLNLMQIAMALKSVARFVKSGVRRRNHLHVQAEGKSS